MARDREIKVSLLGDARSLERAFSRAGKSGKDFHGSLGKVGGGLKTLAKGAAIAGAAVIGLGVIVGTVLVKDMARQQAASVQTNAVIASTGKVAGVTRKHVEALATAIQNKSGMDDQAAQSGENMLLTFTKIRNEAGKGNKIFDQSVSILADMSTAMGTDPQKAAIQLGKALNDPIKGITALSKVGVAFTQTQKDSIKALVESGNVMGAQKIILKELNTEFGGSAKAMGQSLPGQINILKGRLMDLGTTLLSAALPALNKLTRGAIEVVAAIQRNMPQIKAAWAQYGAPVFAAIITAGQRVVSWTRENWPQIKATIKAVIDWIATNIVPTVRAVVNDMIALWNKFGARILAIIKPKLEALRATIEAVMALIRGDWGAAWGHLKVAVSKTFEGIKQTMLLNVDIFKAIGAKLGGAIVSGLSALPGLLAGVASSALQALTDKLLSFHVSIKTKTYLGVPFPVGMSVGFDGGGGSKGDTPFSLPSMSVSPGGALTGGLKPQGSKPSKSFVAGTLPKLTGGTTGTSVVRASTPGSGSSGASGGAGSGSGGASDAADKAKAKLQALADAASKVRDIVVSRLQEAFAKVGDFALKAFDGATGKGLQRLQDKASKAAEKIQASLDATLRTISDTQAALTPAEQALKDLQAGHDQAGRDAETAGAATALAAAMAIGDPDAIAAAQKAVDDAAYNQRIFDLGVQATAERVLADQKAANDVKAAQDKAAKDQKAIDDKLAQDTLNYSAARELQRSALEAQLDDFKAILNRHPAAWKAVHKKVMGLFADDFGPDFTTAGENIGQAYIKGLATAFAGVGSTVGAAQAGVNKSNAANKNIPHLAGGGIVRARPGGTLALLGEAGRDEAVVPLGRGGLGAGVHIGYIDMRDTGGDPAAIERRLDWSIRLAAVGA